ncbi:MAG: hypothetical protein HQK83_19425 [Fibrobacteria bacterium]|nr:hypothetical protein [Fibrobacteria bacterium]
MHLGTNDAAGSKEPTETTIGELSQIIDILRDDNPDIFIFLAQIIPVATNAESNAINTALNEAMPALQTLKSTKQSPIVLVDHNSFWDAYYKSDTADCYDNVHPSPRGEEKMATRWFNAFNTHFGPKVISPNGGEQLTAGALDTLTWRSLMIDDTTAVMDSVKLSYKVNDDWVQISGPIANTGSFVWSVPDIDLAATKLLVSSTNDSVSDTSDISFSIVKATSVSGNAPARFTFSLARENKQYELPLTSVEAVSIFDIQGKKVSSVPVKGHTAVWNKKDFHNAPVVNGVYLADIKSAGSSCKIKMYVSAN